MTRTVYTGGRIFDADSGTFHAGELAVADGRIAEVGDELDGDEVVDVAGCTVLPGLFDCHVHVNAWTPALLERAQAPFSYQFYAGARNLALTLASGVTTVRDAGGADLGLKRAVEDGTVLGPNLVLSINAIGTTGGHTDPWKPGGAPIYHWMPHPGRPHVVADGPEGMRLVARNLFRAGADVLKVCTSGGVMSLRDSPHHAYLDESEVAALVAEAAMRDSHVMAHAQGVSGIAVAVDGGVRSIEHGTFLTEELAARMVERGTWLVPTLSVCRAVLAAAEAGVPITPETRVKATEAVEAGMNAVRIARDAGVRIALGTDAGVGPHGRALDEVALLAEAGLSPGEVWQAATKGGADLLGSADRGRLAPGLRADLLVLAGDGEDLVGLDARVHRVVRDGVDVTDRLRAIIGADEADGGVEGARTRQQGR